VASRFLREGGVGEAADAAAKAVAGYAADGPHAERMPKAVVESTWNAVRASERKHQARVLRCIFGNPFRPVILDLAILTWHGGLLVSMARRMYGSRDFSDMPVLADAMEETGWQDQDILSHCRSGGEHVRGCWAIDLLLGKG
jgi:hypothetical protein